MSRINKLKTMSRKSKLIVLLVFLECIFSFLTYKAFQNGVEFHNNNEVNKNQFNVKYEVDGSYVDWTESTFPSSDDYELDLESSSCVSKSGSIVSDVLSYTDSKVTVSSNQTLYCTLYFKVKLILPQIGDFVDYDAGTWTQEEIASIQVGPNSSLVSANNSTSAPSTSYQFGEFTVGTSRNTGALEYKNTQYMYAKMYDNGDSGNQVAISGWRIWDIDEENETLTLVSAANPEAYYHSFSTNSVYVSQYILTGTKNANWSEASSAESTYTIRDWSMYENETYGASNARMLSDSELTNWYNKNLGTSVSGSLYDDTSTLIIVYSEPYLPYQNLIDNHAYYWLGVAGSSTYFRHYNPEDHNLNDGSGLPYGIRVLVNVPLSGIVNTEMIGNKTVTINGQRYYENGYKYYGPETTQTYNVWKLKPQPQIGDFVTYDAGTWTEEEIASIQVGPNSSLVPANNSLDAPTLVFQFGGFTEGSSRNDGVSGSIYSRGGSTRLKMYDNGDSSNQVPLSGWRIWDIDEENGTLTIVSADAPEIYLTNHEINNSAYISQYILTGTKDVNWSEASAAESTYTKRDWSMYENSQYGATNARMLSDAELVNWYNKNLGTSVSGTLFHQNSTFQMIYSEPYLKYLNLIDPNIYYWVGSIESAKYALYFDPLSKYLTYLYGDLGFGTRILVSLPLEFLVGSEDIGDRTATVRGKNWAIGTLDTPQTYNVWHLNEIVYYAYGDPTTASPTTPPAGKNLYVGLYPGGEKAVCINRNGTQHCFKNNNVELEQAHVQEVFSDISCIVDSSYVDCDASGFDCYVDSDGNVSCYDYGTNEYCGVWSDGYVMCS